MIQPSFKMQTCVFLLKGTQTMDAKLEKNRCRIEGYFSVQFGQEFGALAKILGLTRSDGEEIRKCYMTYLEVFVSYYKTARAPENPMREGEDSESLEEYQWKIGKMGASNAAEKGKEKLEHFGIKLEEEEDCKLQQTTYYGKKKSIFF
ncbi:hypothetical protein Tco_1180642 [Tanacetum coccineum]